MQPPKKRLHLGRETLRHLQHNPSRLKGLPTPRMQQAEGGWTTIIVTSIVSVSVFGPLTNKFFNSSASNPPNSNPSACLCPPEESDFCPPESQSCPPKPIPIKDWRFHM